MDEETARKLLSLALSLDRDLAVLFDTVATVPDEALRRRLDRAVGDLGPHGRTRFDERSKRGRHAEAPKRVLPWEPSMGFVARDLVFPIERLFFALRSPP